MEAKKLTTLFPLEKGVLCSEFQSTVLESNYVFSHPKYNLIFMNANESGFIFFLYLKDLCFHSLTFLYSHSRN